MATRIVSKTDLRDRIREELESLGDDSLVITERGKPVAVAVSVERWNELQGLIEDLEDRVAILEHRSAKDRGRPVESVLAEIGGLKRGVPRSRRKTG